MAKTVTLEQAKRKLQRAIRFLENVGDDRVEQFRTLSPQQYAERRHLTIENPSRRAVSNERRLKGMPDLTRAELQRRVRQLESENDELTEENQLLSDKIEAIGELLEEEDEGADEGDEDDEELAA